MMKHRYFGLAFGVLVLAASLMPLAAQATPSSNSAVLHTRIFNDCPISILSTTNNYPASVQISDTGLECFGFANLHNWHLSSDGVNDDLFANNSCFTIACDLVIDAGTKGGEGGLQLSPWWSPDVDGRFNVRTTDGEIACFGGRLPFYSFTGAHGLHYVPGTSIHLEMVYDPNTLSAGDPATITYNVVYNGTPYSSGALAFDQGNPAEDPPHGQWGLLNFGRLGGYVQCFNDGGNPAAGVVATWSNITYETCQKPTPTQTTTWGRIKGLYR